MVHIFEVRENISPKDGSSDSWFVEVLCSGVSSILSMWTTSVLENLEKRLEEGS